MEERPIREVGAEVIFDCTRCDAEIRAEIGGPGDDQVEIIHCPTKGCGGKYVVKLEVEPSMW